MTTLITENIHSTWRPIVTKALAKMDANYLYNLEKQDNWLPGQTNIFNAFSLPLEKTKYILFGESPYPRQVSANGYAFWDANVGSIWSETGLSKPVNRATSLRNLVKMLLITKGLLSNEDTSQSAIAKLDKNPLVKTLAQLFVKLKQTGFLLLNASLVLSDKNINFDAKAWRPFMAELLEQLQTVNPDIELILLGNIAKAINKLPAAKNFKQFQAEHPYNISFIKNKGVQNFFKPFDLLGK